MPSLDIGVILRQPPEKLLYREKVQAPLAQLAVSDELPIMQQSAAQLPAQKFCHKRWQKSCHRPTVEKMEAGFSKFTVLRKLAKRRRK